MAPLDSPAPSPPIADEPQVMRTRGWADYALLDSGGGRKLERYGRWTVVRPEAQCLWAPALAPDVWAGAHAVFEAGDEEDAGRWTLSADPPPAAWPMAWGRARFQARLTAFRHLAVFPEQAANWDWLSRRLGQIGPGARVLNLFGYTGVASLVAAAAGATVTHVDASRKAVAWARENAAVSGLEGAPIRWICEDARKYVQRELRRGSRYDGIILDPPKYGRGPAGEVWRLYDDLPAMVAACAALLDQDAAFLLLNAYSERLSGLAMANLMAQSLTGRGGRIDWGELTIVEADGDRGMGLSVFARWSGA